MKTLQHLGPSPEHAASIALWSAYEVRANKQIEELEARGLDARRALDLIWRWRDGWNTQDIELLRSCLSEDCGFIDSTTFHARRVDREETLANCAACFEAFPDMAFYPQDDTIRSLPYLDFSEGQWRVVIPWRGIARWTGPMRVPGIDAVFPPTGRCLNFIGVDRYTISEDWKITHIDTDWDMLYGAVIQLSPVGISSPSERAVQVASRLARIVVPLLRGIGSATPEGHRRFALPTMAITTAEDWRDINQAYEKSIAEARKEARPRA